MINRRRELNLNNAAFDSLRPGEVSLHVPFLKGLVFVLMPDIETTHLMHVDIQGEAGLPPESVSLRLEDDLPFQIMRRQNSPAAVLERPVNKIDFSRSPGGAWLPDEELRIRSGGWRRPNEHIESFEEFTRRVTGHSSYKQQAAIDKARREDRERAA